MWPAFRSLRAIARPPQHFDHRRELRVRSRQLAARENEGGSRSRSESRDDHAVASKGEALGNRRLMASSPRTLTMSDAFTIEGWSLDHQSSVVSSCQTDHVWY